MLLADLGKAVLELVRAGIPTVAGTDTPNVPDGIGVSAELEMFARSGLTPVDALKIATISAAEAHGCHGSPIFLGLHTHGPTTF